VAELIIKPEAEIDLEHIRQFSFEQFAAEIAEDYLAGLRSAFLRLMDHPEFGSVFRGVKPEVRCLTYRSHKLYYDFDGKTVGIVRILHQARNAEHLLN
jgi:plasmid stabilization system protein ParE